MVVVSDMSEADGTEPPILDRIRDMWEFAATTQFLYLFYDMFGLDEFDVEVYIYILGIAITIGF